MYTLTLTRGERSAIDWIGNRYHNGRDLFLALCDARWVPDDRDWDDPGDIIFHVPEHVAWNIAELGERNDNLWPCFAPDLVEKMQNFCVQIV